jgi:hypothetical protein
MIVAFDINGTLLRREYKGDKRTHSGHSRVEIKPDITTRVYDIYLRPNIQELVKFLRSHDVKYLFWSTMMRKNLDAIMDCLATVGFDRPIGSLCVDECEVGKFKGERVKTDKWVKNMKVVAEKWGVPLDECVLVDDCESKNAEGCEFIHVDEFMVENLEDKEILRICDALHSYIKCNDIECIKRYKN